MSTGPLSAEDIRRLFEELSAELDARGTYAELLLVGGAAICPVLRWAPRDPRFGRCLRAHQRSAQCLPRAPSRTEVEFLLEEIIESLTG